MSVEIYDQTQCKLGEGPLWHPEREQLLWFDILRRRIIIRYGDSHRQHKFNELVSAAGWINQNSILVASETRLIEFDLKRQTENDVCALEADDPKTRSNDGRADPKGGFWIGTMGKKAEKGAGAIYRFYKGELRKLFSKVTIPNAICFSPDGSRAYFADTKDGRVLGQALDSEGWPKGEPTVFLDLRDEGLSPDGAVTDAQGNFWNAQWGASRVACYAPDGSFVRAIDFPARHTSCPAFGGADFSTLYCTSAQELLSDDVLEAEPENGQTFMTQLDVAGRPEPAVIL